MYLPQEDNNQMLYRLVIGPLLHDIHELIDKDQKGLYTFSTHDNTLSWLLSVMKITMENFYWPPYASYLIIERYTHDDQSERDRYALIYNGIPLDRVLFNDVLDMYAMGPDEWNDKCT
jgi:hypothetical protein